MYFLGSAFVAIGILGAIDWSRRKESTFLTVFYIFVHFFACFALSVAYYMVLLALTVMVFPETSEKTIDGFLYGSSGVWVLAYSVVAVMLAIKTVDLVPRKGVNR